MHQPALILVVDDNEANVDILQTRLEALGYAVITACDGEEAIDKTRSNLPDLILPVFGDRPYTLAALTA